MTPRPALDARDLVAFVGLAMMGVGLWLVSPSLALIVVGAVLLLGALLSAELAARRVRRSGGRD
jgi:uncharacterized membrane protein